MAAGSRHQKFVEAQAFADQPRDAVVRVGAGAHAVIAARAAFQIHHQQALRFHQALREEGIERRAGGGRQALLVLLLALARPTFQALANGGELLHHLMELFGVDAHHFHVIERGAGGRAHALAQQPDFAEISAAAQIGQHQIAARMRLGHFHEADAGSR